MNDESALQAAIRAAPDDDTPRLVYADWLDEHDRPARAEFIRLQIKCERYPAGVSADGPSLEELREREYQLIDFDWCELGVSDPAWRIGSAAGVIEWHDGAEVRARITFRRGFVEEVSCSPETWLEYGDFLVFVHPITRVQLTDWIEWEADEESAWFARDTPYRMPWVDILAERTEAEDAADYPYPALLRLRWPGIAFSTTREMDPI